MGDLRKHTARKKSIRVFKTNLSDLFNPGIGLSNQSYIINDHISSMNHIYSMSDDAIIMCNMWENNISEKSKNR